MNCRTIAQNPLKRGKNPPPTPPVFSRADLIRYFCDSIKPRGKNRLTCLALHQLAAIFVTAWALSLTPDRRLGTPEAQTTNSCSRQRTTKIMFCERSRQGKYVRLIVNEWCADNEAD